MNVKGVREDKDEEVVDPFYVALIKAFPLAKIDCDSLEEDNL